MIGIVLLNYNTPDDVLTCVEHIKAQTKMEYKIYIVDNASTDDSCEIFENAFMNDESIVLLKSKANNGFSAGNNVGIVCALQEKCEYICLINADVILLNDALSVLVGKMRMNSAIGVAAPIIMTPGSTEESQFARNKLTFSNYIVEKSFLKKVNFFSRKYPRYQVCNKSFSDDYLFYGMTYGCMYVMQADFFRKKGLLDEEVFLFNEEDILAYKLEECDLLTLISPEAKVLHNHHSSISKTSVANRIFHLRVSPLVVLRKYGAINNILLFFMVCGLNVSWCLKSLRESDFRELRSAYYKRNREIMGMKRGSGLGQDQVNEDSLNL